MKSTKIARSSLVLIIGQGGGQLLSLIRNAIIGHLLTPEDFGIAATFAITVSAIEMASDLAVDRLLVQSKKGNDPGFQGATHLFMLLRGLFGAIIIFIAAPYVAHYFDLSNEAWVFYWLALIPLVRGFSHLDVKRFQREMNFKPYILSEFIPQLITCMAAYPVVIYIQGYSSVMYLTVLQAILLVLMSHVLAKRKYTINAAIIYFKDILTFGWPLLINGVLMFFIFQGDKLIIGATFDKAVLGVYSAAFMIAMMPAMIIIKALTPLLLSYFSKQQDNYRELMSNYALSAEIVVLIASLYVVFFVIFGGDVLQIVFGQQYQDQDILVAYISIVWAVRLLRVPPTILAMAKGDTKVALVANVFRTISLFAVVYVCLNDYSIEYVAIACFIGEFLALFVTIFLVKIKYNVNMLLSILRLLLFIGTLVVVYYMQHNINLELGVKTGGISTFFICSVVIFLLFFIFPTKLRRFLFTANVTGGG